MAMGNAATDTSSETSAHHRRLFVDLEAQIRRHSVRLDDGREYGGRGMESPKPAGEGGCQLGCPGMYEGVLLGMIMHGVARCIVN